VTDDWWSHFDNLIVNMEYAYYTAQVSVEIITTGGGYMFKPNGVIMVAGLLVMSNPLRAAEWITNITPDAYFGASGTVTFDDWGFVGPTGVGAGDFQVGSGFDAAQLGQVQRVQTVAPDRLTPDGSMDFMMSETYSIESYPWFYTNASLDGQVNFYKWVYTTPASTFNNMQIDSSGNYFIAKEDMSFGFYDTFSYHDTTGVNADRDIATDLKFQPYAISDAEGWCGSVMSSNPSALEAMAGQVKFDFAFDQCGFGTVCGEAANPQLVPDFVMRSYGTITVDVNKGGDLQQFSSSAVINNTNPETGLVDEDYYNHVSFHGAGVVPTGAWTSMGSYEQDANGNVLYDTAGKPIRKLNASGTWDVTIVDEGTEGAIWKINEFGGYAFILRADGLRILEAMDYSLYPDFSGIPVSAIGPDGMLLNVEGAVIADLNAVPVPPAVWLLGSGLLGLLGVGRRKVA
jgi:hypothetical protein